MGETVNRLCDGLQRRNIVGTIQPNRLQGANSKLIDVKTMQKQKRGSCSVATSSDNITVLKQVENKVVHMVSSYCENEPQDTIERWDRKNKKYININRPQGTKQLLNTSFVIIVSTY